MKRVLHNAAFDQRVLSMMDRMMLATEIARELGVSDTMVRNVARRHGRGFAAIKDARERERMQRLRGEVRILRTAGVSRPKIASTLDIHLRTVDAIISELNLSDPTFDRAKCRKFAADKERWVAAGRGLLCGKDGNARSNLFQDDPRAARPEPLFVR